jgi:plastocyanin
MAATALTLLVLALTGGVQHRAHAQPAAAVTIQNFAFMPATLTVASGTSVTWTQRDQAPHTATSGAPGDADAGAIFASPQLAPGETFSFRFTDPGTYPYFCEVHPRMRGVVEVTGATTGAAPAAPPASPPAAAPPAAPAAMPTAPPGPGMTGQPPLPAGATVVAGGLVNPRGFTWGPDGSLYVAESGTPPAGYTMPAGPAPEGLGPVTNMNGRILRIAPSGVRTTVASDLPVSVGPLGDTIGVTAVSFVGSTLYALISAGPVHGHPDFPSGLYRVESNGRVTLVADTDAFALANPPAFIPEDDEISNPYDMVVLDGMIYATDGNRSVVWEINPATGAIRYLTDLSVGHPVLTGIAAGPDGSLYVTELTAVPFPPGAATVRRITRQGAVAQVATGLSAATGLAVSPAGAIYAAEIAGTPGAPPFLVPPGRIVTVGADGVTTLAAPVFFPTMMRWGPNGLYITSFSVGGDAGTGAIVRLATPAAPQPTKGGTK